MPYTFNASGLQFISNNMSLLGARPGCFMTYAPYSYLFEGCDFSEEGDGLMPVSKDSICRAQHLPTVIKPPTRQPLPPHSTYLPCFRCHPSILSSPYLACTLFLPSGQRTHAGFESPSTQTISSGAGRSVSMAEAKGWMSSGQFSSHSQSIEEQLPQKERSEEQGVAWGVPGSLVALYFLYRG